jgi:urease alpha subunit
VHVFGWKPERPKRENAYKIYRWVGKFGGGKVLREGMGQATGYDISSDVPKVEGSAPTSHERSSLFVVETVITNALILDYTGSSIDQTQNDIYITIP